MTALLASGIPILDETGSPVPFDPPPSGPAMEAWEVHALAATDPARHSRLAYRDLPEIFPGAVDADAFNDALSLDLRTAAFVSDVAGQRWAFLVATRDPAGYLQVLGATDTDNRFLDGLQVQLVLHRLAVDLWKLSLEQPSGNGISLAAYVPRRPRSNPVNQAPLPCRHTDTEDKIVTVAEDAGSKAMGEVIGYLEEKGLAGMGALAKASMVADIAQFIAPYLLLEIDFELTQPPLVRTKSTSADGAQRQLAATMRFNTGDLQLVNCFRMMFASMGMTFPLPQDGPLANGSVSWEPNGGFERVQFFGGDVVHAHTDNLGIASIGVEGRRQLFALSPTAGQVNTEASILLTYRTKEIQMGWDQWDAAIGGANPLNIILEGLSRAKWSSAGYTFPVVDWGERWQVEIVINERSETGSVYLAWTGVLGVDGEAIIVGDGVGSLAVVTTLCVDIGPDRHSEAIDWRLDADFTFKFDGYKEDDVLHLLLPTQDSNFRQAGDPGPCAVTSAFHRATFETMLATMASFPIQLRARPGTQSIPYGEDLTMTIRVESVSD